MDFFSTAGEVKYFRFCSRDSDNVHYGLIEFVEQESIVQNPHRQTFGSRFYLSEEIERHKGKETMIILSQASGCVLEFYILIL